MNHLIQYCTIARIQNEESAAKKQIHAGLPGYPRVAGWIPSRLVTVTRFLRIARIRVTNPASNQTIPPLGAGE
jgi:hypothetical protein